MFHEIGVVDGRVYCRRQHRGCSQAKTQPAHTAWLYLARQPAQRVEAHQEAEVCREVPSVSQERPLVHRPSAPQQKEALDQSCQAAWIITAR
eukprot:2943448-Prymnesium_polylepis.1